MDLLLKLISVLFSLGMLYTAYTVRRLSGSWLLPASLYSVAWFLFSIIPLVTLPVVPINPLAVGFILLTCIAFAIPVLTVRWDTIPSVSVAQTGDLFDRPFLRIAFYIFSGITFISLLISTAAQGVSLGSLSSNFFQTSNALISDRYNQTTTESIFTQLANVGSYVSVCLAGLIYPGYRAFWGRVWVLLIAMTPSLLVMTVFGAKGMIFLCIAMFYAGTLVRRLRNQDYRLIDRSTMVKGMIAVLVLAPFVTVSFIARGLYEGGGTDLMDGLFRYYVSYSSAHLYAYSDWFSWYIGMPSDQLYNSEEVSAGFYTFMSIFRILGSTREVLPGIYQEYYQYSWYLQTNIYTLFRGTILDFTLPGALVFFLFLGLITNRVYISMHRSADASWSIAFYIVFAGFVYTSFIISLFIWNSMYPVFLIISTLLILNNNGYARDRLLSRRTVYSRRMQLG